MTNLKLAIAAVFLAWPTVAGAAPACGPLKLMNQVQLQRDPETQRVFIPVSINGVEKSFLLFLNSWDGVISPNTVEALNLPTFKGDGFLISGDKTSHVSEVSSVEAKIKEISFGQFRDTDRSLPVRPSMEGVDGYFGFRYLFRFDVDIDFGNNRLQFFSPEHCEGGVLYWQAPVVGVASLGRIDSLPVVDASIEGHNLKAVVSVSTPQTTITRRVAQSIFGLKLGSLGTEEFGDPNTPDEEKVYQHRFAALSLGDLQVKNALVLIVPDLKVRNFGDQQTTASRAHSYREELGYMDMYLGMNVLSKLHVYLAFAEKHAYFSPAAAVGAPGPTTAPAVSQ